MKIPFSTFQFMHAQIKQEMLDAFEKCYDGGWFIQGAQYQAFEKEFAEYCGAGFCAGVGNGLDAISLALKALKIREGDEVIIPAHTFIATALAVKYAGATPVLCDIEPETFTIDPDQIEERITDKTRAVIAVHLYGQTADMAPIQRIAEKHGLAVIEDAAQAHGATYQGKRAGTLGTAAAFSFYPGKNLGALGDGGAVTSDRQDIIDRVHALGNYGAKIKYFHEYAGVNSRLDEIQAAFLRIKLKHLEDWTEQRRVLAKKYKNGIHHADIMLPAVGEGREHVWHVFVIRSKKRDRLKKYLEEKRITTQIHYPIPVHLQKCMSDLNYPKGAFPVSEAVANEVLSLPFYIGMGNEEIRYVCEQLNRFEE